MTLYALICTDKPNSVDLRMRVRPDHLDYLNGLGDRLKAAGPFTDEAGSPIGTLAIIEAKDRAGAEDIAKDDPYAKAGLFAAVEIRAWKWGIKNPEVK
jgi:uncharacterized protein YciI